MTLADKFLAQAAQCERMSQISYDQTNKMVWRQLADIWRQFAELQCENPSDPISRQNRPPEKARLH